jgi:hypothetical protein
MTLEVRLDSGVMFKSSIPLCRARRDSDDRQGQASQVDFTFRPTRTIVWTGYRETADTTTADQPIEMNIWQAGADPDALTIGMSFMDTSRILMNTIHIAHPGRRDESSIASGLSVLTYPSER